MLNNTTAIYYNRIKDKRELESSLKLEEQGNDNKIFYTPNGTLFAIGYQRIVYGDHGAYIEFILSNIKTELISKFNNFIDYNNLPDLNCKYYYFYLIPKIDPDIKVYLQIKPVSDLPNAPKRLDNKPSRFNRKEGYADYKRGFLYVNPYDLRIDS